MEAAHCDIGAVTFLEEGLVGEIYAASRGRVIHAVFNGAAPDPGLCLGGTVQSYAKNRYKTVLDGVAEGVGADAEAEAHQLSVISGLQKQTAPPALLSLLELIT